MGFRMPLSNTDKAEVGMRYYYPSPDVGTSLVIEIFCRSSPLQNMCGTDCTDCTTLITFEFQSLSAQIRELVMLILGLV
jgi:hypothetical protein